jgi:hypothetical protein
MRVMSPAAQSCRSRASLRSWLLAAGLIVVGGSGLAGPGCLAARNDPPNRPANEPDMPGPEGDGGTEPTFENVVAIFQASCVECHAGANAPNGLDLTAGAALADLVDQPSTDIPGRLRVAPGDAGGSYLVDKLRAERSCNGCMQCEPDAICGERMPFGGPALPEETIALIEAWIDAGAPGPSAGGDGGPVDMTGDAPPADMTGGDMPADMTQG